MGLDAVADAARQDGLRVAGSLLSRLLPPGVVLRQRLYAPDAGDKVPPLHPDEFAAVARAVPARKLEFAAGRDCARQALHALCGYTGAIPARSDRSPQWPLGVVGSITHDDGIAAAAVARRSEVAGIGIDIDRIARFDDALAALICGAAERAWWQAAPTPVRRLHLALLFCIKEAVYKAQHPLTGAWLDFTDLQVTWPAEATGRPGGESGQGEWRAVLMRTVAGWPVGHVFIGGFAFDAQRVAATLVLRDDDCRAIAG